MLKKMMWILWPSFIAAGIGVGIIFTLIDPMELVVLGGHVHTSRTTVYSLGFFVIWSITAMASAMSCFLAVEVESKLDAIDDTKNSSNFKP